MFFRMRSTSKHILHCFLFGAIITLVEAMFGGIHTDFDAFERYGFLSASILYFLRVMTICTLPITIVNFLGLVFYNAFQDTVKIKGSPSLAPFICFRIVTRGMYPQLVGQNVLLNMNLCLASGLDNFIVEVVTDKRINLPFHPRVRETVVPSTYRTKSGALYKARALQYCLEDDVNVLQENDWIVHLDEETLLTESSINGVINFVLDGQYQFGQGLITYANGTVINWLTTLADCVRVADDMGKVQLELRLLNAPIFNWKGSYIVALVSAERSVTFDNGIDGSIAEDCYFGMRATNKGFRFNFIEGDMWERSPFTMYDFLKQRKRWMQGIYLVVRSPLIPLWNKLCLSIVLYSSMMNPLNMTLPIFCPIPTWQVLNFVGCFSIGVTIYMYIFGVLKSFSLRHLGMLRYTLLLFSVILTLPLNIVIENVAMLWGLFTPKHEFHIIDKTINHPIKVQSV